MEIAETLEKTTRSLGQVMTRCVQESRVESGDKRFNFCSDGQLEFHDEGHPARIIQGLRLLYDEGKFVTSIQALTDYVTQNTSDSSTEQDVVMSPAAVLSRLNEYRLGKKFIDLSILTQNKMFAFPCHRAVMASSSSYFRCLLDGGFLEDDQPEIVIHGLSSGVLVNMIGYAYTGRLLINKYNAQTLFQAGLILQFDGVQEACCEFMLKQLEPENCVGIMRFAEAFACKELHAKAFRYAVDNFYHVSQSREIVILSKDNLLELLTSDRQALAVEGLCEAVLTWVRHDVEDRKGHLSHILDSLQLEQMKPSFIETVLEKDPLVESLPECLRTVRNAKHKISKLNEKKLFRNVIVIVGGTHSGRYQKDIDVFDPRISHWGKLPCLPIHLQGSVFGLAALDNDLYVVAAGEHSQDTELWRYTSTVQTNAWKRLRNANIQHNGSVSICALNGYLYSIGDSLRESRNERYRPDTNNWEDIPPLVRPLMKITSVACMGRIYVLGYHGNYSDVLEIQAFNPMTRQWTVLDAPERSGHSRKQFQAVAMGDLIYLNATTATQNDVYDPGWNMWHKLPAGHGFHVQGSVVAADGYLYELGGRDGMFARCPNPAIDRFDPSRTHWAQVGVMKKPRLAPRCLTMQMSVM